MSHHSTRALRGARVDGSSRAPAIVLAVAGAAFVAWQLSGGRSGSVPTDYDLRFRE